MTWNSGSGYSCMSLLASGMACGFVRIDYLPGRFYGGKVPYQNVESIRGENNNDAEGKSNVSEKHSVGLDEEGEAMDVDNAE